jgi:hypothetical protein
LVIWWYDEIIEMGLEFRKRSGRIANGSRLVVEGQITNGQKVFPNSFGQKSNPYDMTAEQRELLISQNVTPTPTSTFNITPTPTPSVTGQVTPTPTPTATTDVTPTPTPTATTDVTPTPTPTPQTQLIDPIIVGEDTYITVGTNEYLMY